MRIAYMLCFFLALSIPAAAAETDQNLKQEMENAVAAYATTFNKLDPAGMAALYASDGVLVNTHGPFTPAPQRQVAPDSGSLTVGTTPHYVYQAVQKKQGMTGAEVIAAVRADGHEVGEPQIRTALSRLEKRQLLANRHRKWFLK